MCGICGFAHRERVSDVQLKRMIDKISYRGPNDEGTYLKNTASGWQVGLAHRRLSILDLSPAGHQPMESNDKSVVISYNGEVYNFEEIREELIQLGYCFKSNCDTEVILYAYKQWGIECVTKFNGMYAIAIYDKLSECLYLVRDRMGVKPLYYYLYNGNIVFASELKPIMEYPSFKKEINSNGLINFLANQYITGEETIFQNTYKLLPGTILKWKAGSIEKVVYWSIESSYSKISRFPGDYDQAVQEMHGLLRDAVAKRMISDVSIGCFLSGGIDSSLIAAIMQEQSEKKIKTFTIGFNENQYNEADYAEKVAKEIGTEHTCVYMSVNEAKKLIDNIPLYYDEPMADASEIATMLLSKITRKDVTVALSGDAADELFGGYVRYAELKRFAKLKPISRLLQLSNQVYPLKEKVPRIINKMFYFGKTEDIIYADYNVFWDQYTGLLKRGLPMKRDENILNLTEIPEEKYMLYDMNAYLPDDILTKVDRASMAFSLEARTPFLDYRIVEFALSLPMQYKIEKKCQKRILRTIAYKYVSQGLLERPKQGFGVPVREWLREDFWTFTRGYFEKQYLERQEIFDVDIIEKMIKLLINSNDQKVADALWTIFVFQMWWDCYMT